MKTAIALFLSSISLSSNDVHSFSTTSFSRLSTPATTSQLNAEDGKKKVVVIGNGMVGQRFMENLIDLDTDKKCTISTFCEEPRAAYNRVKLTSYFETRDPSSLTMTSNFDDEGRTPWYEENNVELLLNDKVTSIDTEKKTVTGESGTTIDYDVAVFATGSYPFVPPIPGKQRPGVFVYRVSGVLWMYVCLLYPLGISVVSHISTYLSLLTYIHRPLKISRPCLPMSRRIMFRVLLLSVEVFSDLRPPRLLLI